MAGFLSGVDWPVALIAAGVVWASEVRGLRARGGGRWPGARAVLSEGAATLVVAVVGMKIAGLA